MSSRTNNRTSNKTTEYHLLGITRDHRNDDNDHTKAFAIEISQPLNVKLEVLT